MCRLFPFPPYLLGGHHHDPGTHRTGKRDRRLRPLRLGACGWFRSSMAHRPDCGAWPFRREFFYNDTQRHGGGRLSDCRLIQMRGREIH